MLILPSNSNNNSGGSNDANSHTHQNKATLDKISQNDNGDLLFDGKNLTGVIFEKVEG